MAKVIIIGAGGVGRVVAFKCAENAQVFTEITLASRSLDKCHKIAEDVLNQTGTRIAVATVNADDTHDMVALFKKYTPDLVIHVALPYQDLSIMKACLECGVHYLDTANYEPREEAKFSYKWQWDFDEAFKKAGLLAILGCGFDPGVTNIFTAYADKYFFDEMHNLDIVDCNGGNHGQAFATNFNAEINIREITQNGKYWKNGRWITTKPFEICKDLTYPNIGKRTSYLLYHEELESLTLNFPSLKQARFWMTFSSEYLTHLRVIQNIGMASISPIDFEGKPIIPIKFLQAVLPKPENLAQNYEGETSIGCRIRGIKNNQEKTVYIYNNCSHQFANKDTQSQAVSYTTGVPAMVGAYLFLTGKWNDKGVKNVETFNPDPFLEKMASSGLSWQYDTDLNLEL